MTLNRFLALPIFAVTLTALASCAVTPSSSGTASAPAVVAETLPDQGTGLSQANTVPMAPSAGIRAEPITVSMQDLQTLRDRIDSLEKTVGALQADLNKTVPALVKLAAIQREIGDLSNALNTIDQQPVAVDKPVVAVSAPSPRMVGMSPILDKKPEVTAKKPVTQASKPVPAAGASKASADAPVSDSSTSPTPSDGPVQEPMAADAPSAPRVTALRFGVHDGVTRLVLEGSAPLSVKTDIDNTEKIMIIDLPATGWDVSSLPKVPSGGLLVNLAVDQDQAAGHRLVIQLREPASIVDQSVLPPAPGKGHRLVIDLKPAG